MNGTDKYELQFQEIKKSNPSHIFWDSPRRKVFRRGDSVIKFGPGVDAREARTMQYIKEATKVPVPGTASDGANVIVMDYVEGCNLQECWPRLSDAERQSIAEQMRDILDQLRGLEGDYIGAVHRGPAVDMRRSTTTGGPFDSESEFNTFLLNKMISSTPLLYYQAIQQAMRHDHKIVFSHGDLNLHNILVQGAEIVALLDWECAGWYPEHWEYVKFCAASIYEREWHRLGPVLFPTTYPDELILDQFYALFVF
ncbi:MAG: hypothetical protein Q9163_003297 [Psora crenata]